MNKAPILIAAGILGAFAVGGVGLVAITHELTSARIAANERAATVSRSATPTSSAARSPTSTARAAATSRWR